MNHLNIAIRNAFFCPELLLKLFPIPDEEVEVVNPNSVDMFDLLVRLGVFASKGQARKNWTKTGAEIPPGFNHFIVGKLRRELCIWNPINDIRDR